ncbi:MAG: SCP2 sterol-binding domain-containing protein [Flavobacterium sp.]|jgi:acyl-CoA dehydrogenase
MIRDVNTFFEKMRQDAENMMPINATMKLSMENYIFRIDGYGSKNIVTDEDLESDCNVIIDLETFLKIKNGFSDPVTELLEGIIDVEGDLGLAFRLKSLISA